jgi:hypothetical protein
MRLPTKKLRRLVSQYWQPAVFYGMLITFFGMLLWFRLGQLLGGISPAEAQALQTTTSLRHILENPLNAPFSALAYGINLIYNGSQDILPLRAAATVFGLFTLTTFYWLVRNWHGERSAILGTIVFGCSAWFLHTSRLGTPDVLLFLLLALAASSVWLKRTGSRLVLLGGFALAAALLYIPGMILLLVIGAIWHIKTIFHLFKRRLLFMCLGAVGFLAAITPLVWAISKTPELAKMAVGLPAQGWPEIMDALQRLAHVPYNLFLHGPADASRWLAGLPVLDAFSIVMFLFGVYLYVRHWRLFRSKMVIAGLVVGSILISLGGAVSLSILMPFIYILIAAGIGFMLDRWHEVFPRNVIAQSVGVALISLAVIAVSWYGLRHYFIAWPSTPATQKIYTIK